MIQNDQELEVTQERIAYFYRLVAQLRVTTQPENFNSMAGGYLSEIQQMHDEVLEYLKHHASENSAEAA